MMSMKTVVSLAAALLSTCLCAPAWAESPNDPVQALQAQVDDLNRQLEVLHHAADPAAQKRAMQDYWAMLQKQLQYVRHLPGVESRGCNDWVMLDPKVVGRVSTGEPCALMEHDQGPAAAWTIPDTLTPTLFGLMMQQQLQLLRVQVTAIAEEKDPDQRLSLIREHYETRFQDIQTVRRREWMWAANGAAALPDGGSMGAQLLVQYCAQCHAVPPPTEFTAAEWRLTVRYMQDMIQYGAASTANVRIPDGPQLDLIASYLESHAEGAARAQP